MKIRFLIGYPATQIVADWQEISKLPRDEFKPDQETFILYKSLEFNSELEKHLIKARKHLHLPEGGLSWEQYQWRKDYKHDFPKEEMDEIIHYIHNYHNEASKIRKRLNLHPRVSAQLDNLILGNFVDPTDSYMGVGYGAHADEVDDDGNLYPDSVVDGVEIYISKRVSKNEMHKFIESEWLGISDLLNKLPEHEHFYISNRDLRIVEMRDVEKLRYSQIVERITEEFAIDNMDGTLNEDSVKTSYKRAKGKIVNLARVRQA